MLASSSATIHAAIIAALQGGSDIYTVEDWPADVKTWLAQFHDTGKKLPAFHCAFTSTLEPYSTDGTMQETTKHTLTCAFRPAATAFAEYIRLRDIALSALNADWTFGGLADISDPAESAMGEEQGGVGTFSITFTAVHHWTP